MTTKKLNRDDVATDSFVARQIIQEILDFGVNQNQMIKIIQMLALELENRSLMIAINACIEDSLEVKEVDSEKESGLIKDV